MSVVVRPAGIDEIYRLRLRLLRPTVPVEMHHFPGDADAPPQTFHFGAFVETVNVGCASLMLNTWLEQPAYQLRGMAVEEAYRSHGIGSQLLALVDQTVLTQTPIRTLWCNARVPAIKFYERNGWQVMSEVFNIEEVGPHKKMMKSLL